MKDRSRPQAAPTRLDVKRSATLGGAVIPVGAGTLAQIAAIGATTSDSHNARPSGWGATS